MIAYVAVSFLVFLGLAVIWRATSWTNFFIKITLILMCLWSTYMAFQMHASNKIDQIKAEREKFATERAEMEYIKEHNHE